MALKQRFELELTEAAPVRGARLAAAVLTGCQDPHYAFGLVTALAAKDVVVDVIGGDSVDHPEATRSS